MSRKSVLSSALPFLACLVLVAGPSFLGPSLESAGAQGSTVPVPPPRRPTPTATPVEPPTPTPAASPAAATARAVTPTPKGPGDGHSASLFIELDTVPLEDSRLVLSNGKALPLTGQPLTLTRVEGKVESIILPVALGPSESLEGSFLLEGTGISGAPSPAGGVLTIRMPGLGLLMVHHGPWQGSGDRATAAFRRAALQVDGPAAPDDAGVVYLRLEADLLGLPEQLELTMEWVEGPGLDTAKVAAARQGLDVRKVGASVEVETNVSTMVQSGAISITTQRLWGDDTDVRVLRVSEQAGAELLPTDAHTYEDGTAKYRASLPGFSTFALVAVEDLPAAGGGSTTAITAALVGGVIVAGGLPALIVLLKRRRKAAA